MALRHQRRPTALELCRLLLSGQEQQELSGEHLRDHVAGLSAQGLSSWSPVPLYHAAAAAGRADAVAALAAAGAPIALADRHWQLKAPSLRLLGGQLDEELEELLNGGGTALVLAARTGDTEVVRALLAAGADPGAGDPPPLACTCDLEVVQLLCMAGADMLAPQVLLAVEELCHGCCFKTACWLLDGILELSEHGFLPAPPAGAAPAAVAAYRNGLRSLIVSAAACDSWFTLAHFAAQLLRCREAAAAVDREQLLWDVLDAAVAHDSTEVLHAALRHWHTAAGEGAPLLAPLPAVVDGGMAVPPAPTAEEIAKADAEAATAVTDAAAADVAYGLPLGTRSFKLLAAQAAATRQLLGTHITPLLPDLVLHAVFHSHTASLQLLLDNGAAPTLEAISDAVQMRCSDSLRLLLAACRGRPPPVPLHEGRQIVHIPWSGTAWVPTVLYEACEYTCPLLRLLQSRICLAPRGPESKETWQPAPCPPGGLPPGRWDAELLPFVEALVDAGFRPTVYEDVTVQRWEPGVGWSPPRLCPRYDPSVEDDGLDTAGHNRWLWLAIQHPAWSPAQHHRFPPSFKAAVRTLLLAAHHLSRTTASIGGQQGGTRGGRRSRQQPRGRRRTATVAAATGPAASMGSLPRELLLQVLGLAAHPLSSWAAVDAGPASCESGSESDDE
ncbi:hypothetical protein ABPG75_003647 [Micractinium tetrahymenae]